MKNALLVCAGLVALGGTASAADLPLKAPPVVAAIYNWTGFYAGVSGGGIGMTQT